MHPYLGNALGATGNISPAARLAGALAVKPPAPDDGGPGLDGRMQVSRDIFDLLQLGKGMASTAGAFIDATSPPSASAPRRAVRTATIDSNLPVHDYRFMTMSNLALLRELAQLVAGFGPADSVPTLNPGTPGWTRRGGDMRLALDLTPGREKDAVALRAAIRHLDVMFAAHHRLVGDIRQRRPDLEPVLREWSTSLLEPALVAALQAPFEADGSPTFVPALYDRINEPSLHSYDYYLPQLEQRMAQAHQKIFAEKLTRFFGFLSTPTTPGVPTGNGLLGGAKNLLGGPDVRRLLSGKLVFRCSEAELVAHLQMVPAGATRVIVLFPSKASGSGQGRRRYSIDYPARGSGTTIDQVLWQGLPGKTRTVLVANMAKVHSFSIDNGAHWKPTGGLSSKAIDDMRADAWREFLASRWHEHKEGNLRAFAGLPGR